MVVTGVTREETTGQLRIHTFNNAADLVSENITVSIARLSTNEELLMETWNDLTIPSGSERILMSPEVVLDSPHDLRIMIDPVDAVLGDNIRETNELNNVYETPVRMRVQIHDWYIPNGPCESVSRLPCGV